jgi:asparagine synthase (glutamine-hydrolysing)
MAASLESRTPLLDYRLVELAIRIPDRLRFRGSDGKPLLRAAVGPWLPEEVARRRDKRGFPTPLQDWQARPALRQLVESLVSPRRGAEAVFSRTYLDRATTFAPSELWTVLMINGWLAAARTHSGRRRGLLAPA